MWGWRWWGGAGALCVVKREPGGLSSLSSKAPVLHVSSLFAHSWNMVVMFWCTYAECRLCQPIRPRPAALVSNRFRTLTLLWPLILIDFLSQTGRAGIFWGRWWQIVLLFLKECTLLLMFSKLFGLLSFGGYSISSLTSLVPLPFCTFLSSSPVGASSSLPFSFQATSCVRLCVDYNETSAHLISQMENI